DEHNHFFRVNYPPTGSEYVFFTYIAFFIVIYSLSAFLFSGNLNKKTKIIFNVVFIALFFTGAEYSLRFFIQSHNTIHRPHPLLFWELSKDAEVIFPDGKEIKTNYYGFRYEEFPIKKPPGEYRFILVGDSTAYGVHIEEGERFSDLLEKDLQQRFPEKKIRVINAAVDGYSTFQIYELITTNLMKYEPDCILYAVNNDSGKDFKEDKDRLPPKSLWGILLELYQSETYLMLKKLAFNYLIKNNDSVQGKAPECARVSPEDLRILLNNIIKTEKEAGGRLAVISLPLPEKHYDAEKIRYKEITREICKNTNSLFIDVYSLWKNDPEKKKLFLDDVHPDEEGNALIEKVILDDLIKENMIK
ncbi:MAG: SGNH/GDSL hydrolase family protein, partial [Firmicutes bacterium]|nr:SGNH/GDSL hydrolase family protein [Bacillota bacterium]